MEIEDLWKSYKQTKDEELKKQLIVEYLPLVKIIAGRMYNFYGGNVEYDDLASFGIFGLIDSIEKFELERGLKFETYSKIRIRGSMIDSLRKLDWVPRRIRKKAKDIESVIKKLENRYGRTVTDKELAEELEISIDELEKVLSDISIAGLVSLEETLVTKDDGSFNSNEKTPEKVFEDAELKEILANNIDELKENEKMIISMYYFDELTYKEIGSVLGLSESRISQIHSKAIISLKNGLEKKGIDRY